MRRRPAASRSMQVAQIAAVAAICAAIARPARAQNARWGADYFPNATLTTHEGQTVRFYDDLIKGKKVAVDLIYTTCQYACPLETARLAQVQRVLGDRVGRDIFFYSITIDPAHDTPEVLKAYAEKYHAGPGWLFLTGKADDIERISRKLGLYSEPDPSDPDGHTPMLLVGNETTGQWMRNSALDNPRFLATTIGDWLTSWENGAKTPLQSFADAPAIDVDRAAYTFRQHCAACHTIGGGDAIGPDLKGVAAARERTWLERFIATPDRLFAENDPTAMALLAKYNGARMPNLSLSDGDASMLAGYIARETPAARAPSSIEAPRPTEASPSMAARVDLRPILEPYLRIQEALAADRMDGVSEYARVIATEAVKIGSAATGVRVAVNPFAQAEDVKSAREAFAALSDAVLSLVRAGSAPGDGAVVAYCPMARKYWVQNGAAIRNPYYGAAMLTCGSVVESPPEKR